MCILVRASIAVIKHHDPKRGKRNLGTGNEAEAIEEDAYWLAPHDFLSLLSYIMQDNLPMGDTTHTVFGLFTSITNQEKYQAGYSIGQSYG